MTESFPRQHARTRRFTLGAPRTFRVAPDGSRVAFVRSAAGDDPVHRLWVLDVATGEQRCVADPTELLTPGADDDLPPEERARRERAREAGGGIVAYATDPGVSGAVYALGGHIFTTDLLTGETAGLPCADGAFDPHPDPTGERVAYVGAGQLRVTNLAEGDRLLVGEDHPDISWGAAEFAAAEEMGRQRGFWWSPDGARLLVCRVDESDVPVWHIGDPSRPDRPSRTVHYPAAGTVNARVDLSVIGIDGHRVDIGLRAEGVELEYVAAAGWAPRPWPWVLAQTRDQRTAVLVEIDPATGAAEERYRITDDRWVELVAGTPAWSGERLVTVEDHGAARRLVIDGVPVTGDELQVRRVVGTSDDHVLVLATTDPTELHVVRVGLDGTTTALTDEPGVHGAESGGDVVVITAASLEHHLPLTRVLRSGRAVGEIASLAEQPTIELHVGLRRVGERELATAVLWPSEDPGGPLPVLLDPYGGPHALRVQRAAGAFWASQWFADQGFVVVVTDGAGTPARGPAFEREVWGDLAGPVLEDQVAALEAVAALEPRVDLGRVAIRGWSFGGYLAALAVLRRPDVFHAAVAGAPVTDWRLYDTHYTERYLGHPDVWPHHYERTDLTREAHSLSRPLLLIHGLADDNVVAAHTLALSTSLLQAGRPHQVLPLCGVTHMTPQPEVAENLLLVQLAFLRDALGLGR